MSLVQGAISQAALYTLLRIPGLSMHGRIVDDDVTGTSNLNRNMLTFGSDIDIPKVRVVTSRCHPALDLEPIESRFDGRAKLASRVLVGVDDIPSGGSYNKILRDGLERDISFQYLVVCSQAERALFRMPSPT
jgi:hypothetical protein